MEPDSLVPVPPQPSPGGGLWTTLVAGPVAGVLSRLFVHPFDTVKARLQVQGAGGPGGAPQRYSGTADAVMQILRSDGPRGLFCGFGVAAVGSIPGNMAYFGGYELGKLLVPPGMGMPGDMAVGAVAQLVAGAVFTPVDVVKERLQVQGMLPQASDGVGQNGTASGGVRGSAAVRAVRALVLERGVLGLMRGYWATNVVWIPWNMLFIAMYEASKRAAVAAGLGEPASPSVQVTTYDGMSKRAAEAAGPSAGVPTSPGGADVTASCGDSEGSGTTSLQNKAPVIPAESGAGGGAPGLHQERPTERRKCESDARQEPGDSRGSGSRPSSHASSRASATSLSRGGSDAAAAAAASPPSREGGPDATAAALPPWVLGVCSAVSASLAGVLTHPADVVKTRLQVMGAAAGGTPGVLAADADGDGRQEGSRAGKPLVGDPPRLTARSVAADMLRKEGIQSFSRGMSARILMLAPGTALSWAIYEPVKRMLTWETGTGAGA